MLLQNREKTFQKNSLVFEIFIKNLKFPFKNCNFGINVVIFENRKKNS